MFRSKTLVVGLLGVVLSVTAFLYDVADTAEHSIRFDLGSIGRSVYEARQKNGKWPARIADLAGTQYLKMPHRKELLERGNFVIVWQEDLKPQPEMNRGRVLAYDNRSMLSWFSTVWTVRGDLRVESMDRNQLNALLKAAAN
jgi:hypothetical protein